MVSPRALQRTGVCCRLTIPSISQSSGRRLFSTESPVSPTPSQEPPSPQSLQPLSPRSVGSLHDGKLSKSSYVQAMWFQDSRKPPSKEELSRSIEALLEEAPEPIEEEIQTSARVSLLVGEIKQSARHKESDQLVHAVQLCSYLAPRTLVSGLGAQYAPHQLQGRRCVVVTNVPLQDGRGILSEGILLCDADGQLLQPPESAKVGQRLQVPGNKSILKQLELNRRGFAVCHGRLEPERSS